MAHGLWLSSSSSKVPKSTVCHPRAASDLVVPCVCDLEEGGEGGKAGRMTKTRLEPSQDGVTQSFMSPAVEECSPVQHQGHNTTLCVKLKGGRRCHLCHG